MKAVFWENGTGWRWRKIEKAILELYERYGRYQIEALKGSRWIESKWSNESMQQSILKFFSSI